jgi:hypothetical protein
MDRTTIHGLAIEKVSYDSDAGILEVHTENSNRLVVEVENQISLEERIEGLDDVTLKSDDYLEQINPQEAIKKGEIKNEQQYWADKRRLWQDVQQEIHKEMRD